MEGRNERFMSRWKDSDCSRGEMNWMNSLIGNSGGRGSELGSETIRGDGRGGGLRIGSNASKMGGLMMLDIDDIDGEEEEDNEDEDEEVGKVRDSFRELFSEEDIEEDSEAVDEDDGEVVFKLASSFSKLEFKDGPAISLSRSHGGSDSYLSETRFDQCSISSSSLKAIKDAGDQKMTVYRNKHFLLFSKWFALVRDGLHAYCPNALFRTVDNYDGLAKARTDTGKTVAFLILVPTPGRLKDHIENTACFVTRLMGVKVLVLDEADHLLDKGFRKDIEKIIAAVPKQRQRLLFSTTVPQEVSRLFREWAVKSATLL